MMSTQEMIEGVDYGKKKLTVEEKIRMFECKSRPHNKKKYFTIDKQWFYLIFV